MTTRPDASRRALLRPPEPAVLSISMALFLLSPAPRAVKNSPLTFALCVALPLGCDFKKLCLVLSFRGYDARTDCAPLLQLVRGKRTTAGVWDVRLRGTVWLMYSAE